MPCDGRERAALPRGRLQLADTSVWARKKHPRIRGWFEAAVTKGDIAVCDMVVLELLHSASSPAVYRQLEDELSAMPWIRMGAAEWERAIIVYRLLSDRGRAAHRAVPHADLLIAAAAEVSV